MKLAARRFLKPVLFIALLVILLGTVTACQDLGFPPPTTPTETPEPEKPKTTSTGPVSTRDAAILAVYQRLLGQAGSHEAKIYLADFYTSSDNWTAKSDYFKDGAGTWYVVVDMTAVEDWTARPHWQQAGWFVFRDGSVIPSNDFRANALRIEADLQSLSPELQPEEE